MTDRSADDPVNLHRTHVRSHQTDLNGAMYHAAFFDVFDDARIETVRRLDYTYDRVQREGWRLVIHRVDCEYQAPALMDEVIEITVTVHGFTRATMILRFDCRRGEARVARGHITYAFLSGQNRPVRVPGTLRELVEGTPPLSRDLNRR